MKRIIISLAISFLSFAAFSQTQQQPQEKVFTVRLTESQLIAVLNLINDAPIPGADRRAFDKLIRDQAMAQIPKDSTVRQQPTPQVKDKPKN